MLVTDWNASEPAELYVTAVHVWVSVRLLEELAPPSSWDITTSTETAPAPDVKIEDVEPERKLSRTPIVFDPDVDTPKRP